MPTATGSARTLAPMTNGSHNGANAMSAILSCKGNIANDRSIYELKNSEVQLNNINYEMTICLIK